MHVGSQTLDIAPTQISALLSVYIDWTAEIVAGVSLCVPRPWQGVLLPRVSFRETYCIPSQISSSGMSQKGLSIYLGRFSSVGWSESHSAPMVRVP